MPDTPETVDFMLPDTFRLEVKTVFSPLWSPSTNLRVLASFSPAEQEQLLRGEVLAREGTFGIDTYFRINPTDLISAIPPERFELLEQVCRA